MQCGRWQCHVYFGFGANTCRLPRVRCMRIVVLIILGWIVTAAAAGLVGEMLRCWAALFCSTGYRRRDHGRSAFFALQRTFLFRLSFQLCSGAYLAPKPYYILNNKESGGRVCTGEATNSGTRPLVNDKCCHNQMFVGRLKMAPPSLLWDERRREGKGKRNTAGRWSCV